MQSNEFGDFTDHQTTGEGALSSRSALYNLLAFLPGEAMLGRRDLASLKVTATVPPAPDADASRH